MTSPTVPAQPKSANAFLSWDTAGRVTVTDASGLRREGIDLLVRDATFGTPELRTAAQYLIWESAHELGIVSSSIHELYMARGAGKCKGFTVPAMNIRGATYDVVRAALRAAKKDEVGALIFELANSEMGYTHQPPSEYATSVLAAAIKEDWAQPIFIQGDHFQFNAKKYQADAAKETAAIRSIVMEAVGAGFHNIDIDASTLVDLSKKSVPEQQLVNSRLTAEMATLIRSLEPKGVSVSIGGEIGEVGKKNSTPQELRAYVDQFRQLFSKQSPGAPGVSKISVQTGTTHGGVIGKDGKVVEVEVDFETLRTLSEICVKEYGLAGCVQHGASTLPDELFHKFPEVDTAEIHLATGFQNAYFDSPDFPEKLKQEIYSHLEKAHADERNPEMTREEFLYRTRKKAFGPFKQQLWDMEGATKARLMRTLEERFEFMFRQLKVVGTKSLVSKFVKPVRVRRNPSPSLRAHR